jgi:predicted ribonuclease YlaK
LSLVCPWWTAGWFQAKNVQNRNNFKKFILVIGNKLEGEIPLKECLSLSTYTGFRTVEDSNLAQHYENEAKNLLELKPNEFVISSDGKLLKYKEQKLQVASGRNPDSHYMGKVRPKNKEQEMALDLLLDTDIKCVVLIGQAGCGKTFLAANAGFFQVEKRHYDKVFFTRNHVEVGKPLGALPGDVFEKIKL